MPRTHTKGFLVPGWGSDARVFDPLFAATATSPSSSATQLIPEDWTIVEYHHRDDPETTFHEAFIAHPANPAPQSSQPPQPLVAVGWSLGGMLLLNHRHLLPESIKHLILIAVPSQFCNDDHYGLNQPPAVIQAMSRRAQRNLSRELTRFYRGAAGADDHSTKAGDDKPTYTGTSELNTANALNGLSVIESFSALSLAKQVDLPVTLICGERDPICLPASAKHLHEILPQSELITGNWGHLPFHDDPATIAQILQSCLESVLESEIGS